MAIMFKVFFSGRAIVLGRSVTKDPPGSSPGSHPQLSIPQGVQ